MDSRVIVVSLGSTSSGIPSEWSAEPDRSGLYVIGKKGDDPIRLLANQINGIKQPGDIVVVSIHWGGNWGYQIPSTEKEFAHSVIEETGASILHGHSSHHVKAIEVYKERLILYGCGDFINDYEGISGYENFRGDLALMYFADINPNTGRLLGLRMIPTQVRRFRVTLASAVDSKWLDALLNRQGKQFRTGVKLDEENALSLRWQ
jgi:poly-gamma-glutamate synthesis protein (capsule biosynthesis protein)